MYNTEIIPVIDLGPYQAGAPGAINRTAEELHFALTEIGFYFIVNHGVPCEQINAVLRQAARFHTRPLRNKLEVKLDKHNVGYLPMRSDTLRRPQGDGRGRRRRSRQHRHRPVRFAGLRRGLHPAGASRRGDAARRLHARETGKIAGGNYMRIFRASVG